MGEHTFGMGTGQVLFDMPAAPGSDSSLFDTRGPHQTDEAGYWSIIFRCTVQSLSPQSPQAAP
jgi:hypothetical protein